MGSKNSKIPKPKLSNENSASSFPYVRGSKDARARSQQVEIFIIIHANGKFLILLFTEQMIYDIYFDMKYHFIDIERLKKGIFRGCSNRENIITWSWRVRKKHNCETDETFTSCE